MKSRNFPGFPDDHGIITDSRNFHGLRNYGKFPKFGNVRSAENSGKQAGGPKILFWATKIFSLVAQMIF